MAKASIRIKCEEFGQEFTHSKSCWNREFMDIGARTIVKMIVQG